VYVRARARPLPRKIAVKRAAKLVQPANVPRAVVIAATDRRQRSVGNSNVTATVARRDPSWPPAKWTFFRSCRHFIFLAEDFFGHYVEARELRVAKMRRDCNVSSIAATGDNDAPDTRHVVPGIESKPAAVQEHLEPSAEIHRRRVLGNADVAQVARAVSSGDVHAATQRNSQMREVAADADLFGVSL
jgi:hypothetical protein